MNKDKIIRAIDLLKEALRENNDGGLLLVVRGGCWYEYPEAIRSAERNHDGPALRYGNVGFRLVRVKNAQPSDASRVIRGGSWSNSPAYLRSARRNGDSPAWRLDDAGLRLCRDKR